MKRLYFLKVEKSIFCLSSQVEVTHPAMRTSILLVFLWGLSCALPVSIRVGTHEKKKRFIPKTAQIALAISQSGCVCSSQMKM